MPPPHDLCSVTVSNIKSDLGLSCNWDIVKIYIIYPPPPPPPYMWIFYIQCHRILIAF